MAGDPITAVHEAAWVAFESVSELTDLVKAGNRIKFDRRDCVKATVQDGDLPEVILVPRAVVGNLTSTSSSVSFEVSFDWLISTGDYRVAYRIGPVIWHLYRAMVRFQSDVSKVLYNGSPFTNGCFLNSGTIGESDAERNRGIKGFSSALSFTVKMHFPKGSIDG